MEVSRCRPVYYTIHSVSLDFNMNVSIIEATWYFSLHIDVKPGSRLRILHERGQLPFIVHKSIQNIPCPIIQAILFDTVININKDYPCGFRKHKTDTFIFLWLVSL